MWPSLSFEHVLVIFSRFMKTREEFVLFNVYAPCDIFRQQTLWTNLSDRLGSLNDQNICVCGDFNAVRCVEERISVGSLLNQSGITHFNSFIEGIFLVDFPLRGRNFTWFWGDGKSMSRLDHFLLSESWCLNWPNFFQLALTRGLSDHCPLVLSVDVENWGPRPVCMLRCWENFPGYSTFVRDTWMSFHVDGWGGYVLKEKLKLLKLALKEWHQRHCQNLPARMLCLKEKIAALDVKRETEVLLDGEVEELQVFPGNNLGFNGYVKETQIQKKFKEFYQADDVGMQFLLFL